MLPDPRAGAVQRRGIGRRLLILILLVSSLITLILTAFQLYIDFKHEVSTIEQRFEYIQQGYQESLSTSLWNLDSAQLVSQLEGIVRLPDMIHASVTETVSSDYAHQEFSAGDADRGNGLIRSFPLLYRDQDGQRQIGNLTVRASYDGVYSRLMDKATVILISQGIKTFIVSFFILLIIHRLVTRHLIQISSSLSQMPAFDRSSKLSLEREGPQQNDELSSLVDAFNDMHERLGDTLDQLRESNEQLEERVEERTLSLRQQIIERDAAREQLHASEQRFRDIAETASDWFWEMDDQLAFSFVSERYSKLSGLQPEQVIGYTRQQLLDQGLIQMDESQRQELADKTARHEAFNNLEARIIGQDEQVQYIQIGGKPIFDDDRRFLGYRGAGRDITERKRAEEAIRRTNDELEKLVESRTQEIRKLSKAVEQSPVSVIITDLKGNIEYVSPSFTEKTGYPLDEVIGKNPRMFKAESTHESVYRDLWQTITEGRDWIGEFQNRNRDGSIVWVQAHVSPVKDSDGEITHYLAIAEDISLRKEQEQRILHQAQYDSLTDLPNRMLAVDRLSQAIKMANREKQHVAVMYVDLDDFKKVNDTLGHDVGDQLLIEAAQRLGSAVRDGDTVARQGGDEFLIVLNGIQASTDADPIAQKIIHAFATPFVFNNMEFVVSPSVGISVFPDDGSEAGELMKNADSAMYRAKDEGGNGYHFFTAAMNQEVQNRIEIERYLRHALSRNELEVVYQPIIDASSRQIAGVEALLRWHNDAVGNIGPAEFIPVAEQTGLIVPIGSWVTKTACHDILELNQRFDQSLKLSVNVSPRQFRNQDFYDSVKACLAQNLDPTMFEIEITEGLLLENQPEILRLLSELKNLGISLSMDDFGTGYSSLSYLKNLPFDRLKIDRIFVQSITHTPGDLALVTAAITMAHSLGLKVIAEGVETEDQFRILADLGCDYVQGYLFSKPLKTDALEAYLAAS